MPRLERCTVMSHSVHRRFSLQRARLKRWPGLRRLTDERYPIATIGAIGNCGIRSEENHIRPRSPVRCAFAAVTSASKSGSLRRSPEAETRKNDSVPHPINAARPAGLTGHNELGASHFIGSVTWLRSRSAVSRKRSASLVHHPRFLQSSSVRSLEASRDSIKPLIGTATLRTVRRRTRSSIHVKLR